MKHFLLSIIVLWVTSSCTKVVEVDIPEHKAKAVVYSLFKQEDTIKVKLTKSVGLLEAFQAPIENAEVYLQQNGINIDTLSLVDQVFVSDIIAKENQSYEIHTIIPGFGEQFASDIVPKKPIISEIYTDEINHIDEDIVYDREVKFSIDDPATEINYYEVYLGIQYYSIELEQETISFLYNSKTEDPVVINENILNYYPATFVFSDELFNGESYNFSIYYKNNTAELESDILVGDPYSYVIVLRSISEDYYLYQKKLLQHLWNQDYDVWYGLGEPTQMYTNIENGYGIFAGYSEVHKVFFTGIKE